MGWCFLLVFKRLRLVPTWTYIGILQTSGETQEINTDLSLTASHERRPPFLYFLHLNATVSLVYSHMHFSNDLYLSMVVKDQFPLPLSPFLLLYCCYHWLPNPSEWFVTTNLFPRVRWSISILQPTLVTVNSNLEPSLLQYQEKPQARTTGQNHSKFISGKYGRPQHLLGLVLRHWALR